MISLEYVNTAIETTVDLVTSEYNEKARIAKDTSAAAVMFISIAALIVGLIIFVPAAIVVWPVLLVILIFGLPFIIIGVVVGKEKDKEDKK